MPWKFLQGNSSRIKESGSSYTSPPDYNASNSNAVSDLAVISAPTPANKVFVVSQSTITTPSASLHTSTNDGDVARPHSHGPTSSVGSAIDSTGETGYENHVLTLPGMLDLTVIHESDNPNLDLVFVHGLGGGSVRTWCFNRDPALCWPLWLPGVLKLSRARISTFGYNSDIFARSGAMHATVDSFSRKLLHCLLVYQGKHQFGTLPIIFICHSMGGLVVKRACVVADKDPAFSILWKRIGGIIFLGTPHRGSQQARKLNRILHMLGRGGDGKAYIRDLTVNSGLLQMLNGDFRHISLKLQLFSFYEQRETRVGSTKTMIVEPYSAVLDYPHEGSAPLLADHHLVCKYSSPQDGNFITVANTLVDMVAKILPKAKTGVVESDNESEGALQRVHQFLLSPELSSIEGEFYALRGKRIDQSCEWLVVEELFKAWESKVDVEMPHILWLNGLPGTGKTIMSSFIIGRLKDAGNLCAFYFFRSGDASRGSFERCLLSLTYQVALSHPVVRRKLDALRLQAHLRLEGSELLLLWEKIFVSVLLQTFIDERIPLFIVLDAIDEADSPMDLFTLLESLPKLATLRLCVVSRQTLEFTHGFSSLQNKGYKISTYGITKDNTLHDIHRLVGHGIARLPLNEDTRTSIIQSIVEKSEGNFLWVSLVIKRMPRGGFNEDAVLKILREVPPGMDTVYSETIRRMSELDEASKALATWIVRWTVCSFRPLLLTELQHALSFVPPDQWVEALGHWIGELCGNLLMVDNEDRVKPVHKTARDFLQNEASSEYAVTADTHAHIALVCIQSLLKSLTHHTHSTAPKSFPGRNQGGRISSLSDAIVSKRSITSYALIWWSDHLALSARSDLDDGILTLLNDLLKSPRMLDWIQEVVSKRDLRPLVKTAQNLTRFLSRFELSTATDTQKEPLKLPSLWTVDLVRLTTEFGETLLTYPFAIQKLIPPLCPKSSAIYQRFGQRFRGISVVGGTQDHWGMRVTRLMPSRSDWSPSRAKTLACSKKLIAVGYEDGQISLYNSTKCHVVIDLNFSEETRTLTFNGLGTLVAAASEEKVGVWNTSTGSTILALSIESKEQPINTVAFGQDDSLFVITKRKVHIYSISTGSLESCFEWTEVENSAGVVKADWSPVAFALSSKANCMALAYRGLPVSVWDIERGELLGLLRGGDLNLSSEGARRPPGFTKKRIMGAYDYADGIEFNPVTGDVYVTYRAGSVVRFNSSTEKARARHDGGYIIKCSPDGRLIATAGSPGDIHIWHAQTLELASVVETDGELVVDLCFSPDGRRLYDIRADYCNIWEPEILLQAANVYKETATPVQQRIASSSTQHPITITSLAVSPDGFLILTGTDDGWVSLYTVQTGKKLQNLYRHATTVSISWLKWSDDGRFITSGDDAAKFFVHEINIDVFTPISTRAPVWTDITQVVVGDSEETEEQAQYKVSRLQQLMSGRLEYAEAICKLLLQSQNRELLVVTSVGVKIWDLSVNPATQIFSHPLSETPHDNSAKRYAPVYRNRIALNHPRKADEILLITNAEVSVISWNSKNEKRSEIEESVDAGDQNKISVISLAEIPGSGNSSTKSHFLTRVLDAQVTLDGQFLVICELRTYLVDHTNFRCLRVFRLSDIDHLRMSDLKNPLSGKTEPLSIHDVASLGVEIPAFIDSPHSRNPTRVIQIQQFLGIVGSSAYILTTQKTVCSWPIKARSLELSVDDNQDPARLGLHFFLPQGMELGLITVGNGGNIIFTREKDKVNVVKNALAGTPSNTHCHCCIKSGEQKE